MLHLLFTGGTISMQRDERAGGNVPALDGTTLVGFAPELASVGPYVIEDWGRYPACHLGLDKLWALRNRVAALQQGEGPDGAPAGIVITHGTDTLEETAYLLARTLECTVPVVITGAMRTSGEAGWDGPRNLTDAARVAASPLSRGRGTMVVFNGGILAGHQAVKVEATDLAAFGAPHAAPIGAVHHGKVEFADAPSVNAPALSPVALDARVAHIPMVIGDRGHLLELARPTHDGVVIDAFGSGNLPPGAVPAIHGWLADGKPVVLASRCPRGVVTPVYAFAGGGAGLVRDGVIPAGPRTPGQASMELTITLSAGVRYGA
ncbi:MAG: asparaginase [Gemmatimonadales bacterium]